MSFKINQSGNDGKEATPVPIPNTEVKLFCADGSWGSPPVRVGRCQSDQLFRSSSVVEHRTVNAMVVGSSPTFGANFGELSEWPKEHDWKSCRRATVSRVRIPCSPPDISSQNIRPLGQAVKTPPFHGGNTGSNPVGVTNFMED